MPGPANNVSVEMPPRKKPGIAGLSISQHDMHLTSL